MRIERNRIRAVAFDAAPTQQAGGLQIGGGSERVLIFRNEIVGGVGAGVILGSVTPILQPPNFGGLFDTLVNRRDTNPSDVARSPALDAAVAHFASLRREPGQTAVLDDPQLGFVVVRPLAPNVISDGDLTDVTILANEIRDMGASGITVERFFDLTGGEGDFISVHGLEIADNLIVDCLRVRQQPVTQRDGRRLRRRRYHARRCRRPGNSRQHCRPQRWSVADSGVRHFRTAQPRTGDSPQPDSSQRTAAADR